ncbi:hypothetical protein HANVADRAFT_53064 [Hanseniaspora valbyensis NRRL Y-1626]|uniref:DBF4-type domain-containing protein n=1 Tax=Hanseniaspora valbyensis NRRL Y-1626 TaxID=766949 RepID=A0A1B7TCI8_9ASCO|nr:hypothetical protein HANVADRAFT_53064 [Hanseniaspora valbyensis NRRL Y-1626]
MFFDQQSLLQQQLEIEDKISNEKEFNEKFLKSKQQKSPSPSKRKKRTNSNNNSSNNNSPIKNIFKPKNLIEEQKKIIAMEEKQFADNNNDVKQNISEKLVELRDNVIIEQMKLIEKNEDLVIQQSSEDTDVTLSEREDEEEEEEEEEKRKEELIQKKVQRKKELIKEEEEIIKIKISRKRLLEQQKMEERVIQKRIQEERQKYFQKQLELEKLKEKENQYPNNFQKTPHSNNYTDENATDENATDENATDENATDDGTSKEEEDFSTEDEEEYESKNNTNPLFSERLNMIQIQKQTSILQRDSNFIEEEEVEEEKEEDIKPLRTLENDGVKTTPRKGKPQIFLGGLKKTESYAKLEAYKETIKRQKLAIFNNERVKINHNNLTPPLKTPINKDDSNQDASESINLLLERKKLVLQNTDSSSIKKDDNELSGISLENKKPTFKIPKVNLQLQNVSLKRTNDGQIQPPTLKRTRSIDGAKLRSITNILPLQQQQASSSSKEQVAKKIVKENIPAIQQKSEQINLLNSVALAKKEQMFQKKLLGSKASFLPINNNNSGSSTTTTNTAVASVATTTNNNNNSSGSGNSSLDSLKWKNSWRAVMAESKLITILKDSEMALNSEEERLLSVVQAGFRSLGASLTATLDSKTFILVTVGELYESKSCLNVLRLAERMNCKIWNMQKAKRFFKHLDINVEEMEKEFDTMRFIDYAKYTIPVNYKLLEQTKQQQSPITVAQNKNQQQINPSLANNGATATTGTTTSVVTGNNGGKLTEYLNMESKYGHLDRDTTARREDHHYFAEDKPHLYIYFRNQQFAPVVSMEWKCPTTEEDVYKEKNDLDSLPYPTIKYSYNGRSPFVKRDKEEIAYQRSHELNQRKRSFEEMEDCLINGHEISRNLIKQRYERDLAKEDYALLVKRLYSQTSTPRPDNDLYLFDKYYSKKLKKWVPYKNTLSQAFPLEKYDEKRDYAILNAHQTEVDLQEQTNTTVTTSTSQQQQQQSQLKPLSPLGNKTNNHTTTTTINNNNGNTTIYEDTLTQTRNKEIRASGVFIPTNTGTGTGPGTGNGLAPVKASIVSTQMKLLQKRQIQQQQQQQQRKTGNGAGRTAGYCEGCRMKYDGLEKHVKSEKHRSYALSKEIFAGIDSLIEKLHSKK